MSRCPRTLVFGRGKFQGYVKARRAGDSQIDHLARALEKKMRLFRVRDEDVRPELLARWRNWPRCRSPATTTRTLLINGRGGV